MRFSHAIIIVAIIVFPTAVKAASILVESSFRGGVERHLVEKSTKKGKRNKATKPAKVSKTSVNTDVSLSTVDLGSVSDSGNNKTCVPTSGTWGGKSFSGNGPTSFETCYKYVPTGEECWSKSFFFDDGNTWLECQPQGYTGDDQGWKFLNSGAATSTCGSPCEIVVKDPDCCTDDYDYDYDDSKD